MHETPNHWFPRLTATSTVAGRVTAQRQFETSLKRLKCANSDHPPMARRSRFGEGPSPPDRPDKPL